MNSSPQFTPMLFAGVFAVMATADAAAAPTPADRAATTPQPRMRLERGPTTTAVRVAPVSTPATPPESDTVLMPRIVVRDSPLPAAPRPLADEDPKTFSFLKGGPAFTSRFGDTVVQWGLWPLADKNPQESAYKPQKTHAEVEFVRIKW